MLSIPKKYKVSKYARAGVNGKLIYCPSCDYPTKIGHFSWSALSCYHCKKDIKKESWNVISNYQYKNINKNGRNNKD